MTSRTDWKHLCCLCSNRSISLISFQVGALKRHKRTHSSDKPFACHYPGCTWRFHHGFSLNRHLKTHSENYMPVSQHYHTAFIPPEKIGERVRYHPGLKIGTPVSQVENPGSQIKNQTGTPVNQTENPVNQTGAPVNQIDLPAPPIENPASQTGNPINRIGNPVDQIGKAVNETTEPGLQNTDTT